MNQYSTKVELSFGMVSGFLLCKIDWPRSGVTVVSYFRPVFPDPCLDAGLLVGLYFYFYFHFHFHFHFHTNNKHG